MDSFDDMIKGIIALIFLVAVVLPITCMLLPYVSEMQLQPYKQKLEQKEAEIQSLKQQIAQLEQQLEKWKQKYEQLKNETITKEDIEELRHSINLTQTQINLLAQKFDIVNKNFITAYNTYYAIFSVSLIFNVAFVGYIALDFISTTLFEASITMRIVNKFRRRRRKT